MSLQTRLEALVSAIGADIKSLNSQLTGLTPGSYPWSEQKLTTQYTNSTVTASDVFTGFAPLANTRYLVEVVASVTAGAATTGVQTAIVGPTSGVTRSAVKIMSASAATSDLVTHTSLNTFQASAAGLTVPSILTIQAIIEMGATPGAGNIKLQAKSEVAASSVVFQPGSIMTWRTV